MPPKARPKSLKKNQRNTRNTISKTVPLTKRSLAILLAILISVSGLAFFAKNTTQENLHPLKSLTETPHKPEPPKAQWSYLKELPQKNIEVTLAKQAQKTKQYRLQCASFRNARDAEKMQANLAFQGLEANVEAVEGKKGLWHRVVLGPFTNKRSAERTRHQAQRIHIETCKIQSW
ncbi:MAG: SPOR domain-containing protein [Shewanellaceae bacterium]|nr:SPOR domain-containing protein [Shewanellaceae bacterium]